MDMVEKVAWAIKAAIATAPNGTAFIARAAIAAHESALKEKGLVIVPREPTTKMILEQYAEHGGSGLNMEGRWQAMLDAAPKGNVETT